ncbi:hypothetical protein GBAR_LOCUS17622 [Geodia barretti]|uniref:IgGFc-binding protein N-terminal domain-containing protein n=1 Tax=Geodia barretti TaxID=519541 RepID=A0AA35SM17_GEOBA|nr:hypothetical protein GBAR_LOCUS17622 [Geodia barretti]
MMKVIFLAVLFALCWSSSSCEQDTGYYLAFPRNFHFTQSLKLSISTTESEPVYFFVDTLDGFQFRGIVHDNATVTVELPLSFEVTNSTVRNKGIRITAATTKLTVHGLSHRDRTSGMFAALPCVKQNVNKYVYYGVTYNEPSQLLFVACEDGTQIKVGSEVIHLNEMETYLYTNGSDLTGVRVVSNKPISFFSGQICTNIPVGVGFCDFIVEQLPNTALWGSHFLTASLYGRTAPDIYTVVSCAPSTIVEIHCSNSLLTQVLCVFENNYETFTLSNDTFCTITSNHPVLVVQFASGQEADNVESDPFMMMLQPIEQYENDVAIVVPSNFTVNVVAIYVRPEEFEPEKVSVDGYSQTNVNWTVIPCADGNVCGYVAYVSLTEGQHRLSHQDGQCGMIGASVYGFSYHNGYGYPAVGTVHTLLQGSAVSPRNVKSRL